MSKFIAVENSDFEITVTPVSAGSNVIAVPNGTASPTNPAKFGKDDVSYIADSKCTSAGDNILVDKISPKTTVVPAVSGVADDFSCAPLVDVNTWISKGSFKISAGSVKCSASGKKVMLEGDETIVNCVCSGTTVTTPPPTGVPFAGSCSIKISKAGQSVSEAN